ncbi:MAG: transporter substrate-binding domain-containing protein [Candidatus Hodarchaeales archaeon]
MKMKRIALLLTISVMIFSSVALITPVRGADPTGTLATIIDRGTLKVGSDTTYPPFEEINATTNEAQGFDIDIAQIIADDIGVELEIVTSAWDPIIPNLQAEQFDMIISAMTITEAREVEVDFSRWYYQSYQAVLVPAANPKNIKSETDLNQTGLKVGLQLGTTSHLWCNDSLIEGVTVSPYDTILLAIQALKNGQVDVVLGDYAVLALDEIKSAETKVVSTFSPENFGIAMRNGDTDLVNRVNQILDGLLGTDLENPAPNAKYNEIYKRWFEVNAPDFKAAPGFELSAFILVIAAVPIIRKRKK